MAHFIKDRNPNVHDELLHGRRITLRLSTLDDRRRIHDWFAYSDLTSSMAGKPNFPDSPPATRGEFCEDHTPHFFEGQITERSRCFILQVDGEDVGQIYFNDIVERNEIKRVELDMWMRAEKYCGKGYGCEALITLCEFLAKRFSVNQCMVQPSARNPRARQAYEKVAFVSLNIPFGEAVRMQAQNDYCDSVYMGRRMKSNPGS